MTLRRILKRAGLACALLSGVAGAESEMPPLKLASGVDVPRLMGKWHVIANIENFLEKDAYGSVETYTPRADGKIDVLFEFNKGSFDGPRKRLTQLAWVPDPAQGAEWRIQLFWPLRFPYLIIDVAEDHSWFVVGYPSRKLLWVMARASKLDEAVLQGILKRAEAQGYDLKLVQRVPQR